MVGGRWESRKVYTWGRDPVICKLIPDLHREEDTGHLIPREGGVRGLRPQGLGGGIRAGHAWTVGTLAQHLSQAKQRPQRKGGVARSWFIRDPCARARAHTHTHKLRRTVRASVHDS